MKVIKWLNYNFLWLTLFIVYDNVFKDNMKPMWIAIWVLVIVCVILKIAIRYEERKIDKAQVTDRRYMKEIRVTESIRLLKLTEKELDEVDKFVSNLREIRS